MKVFDRPLIDLLFIKMTIDLSYWLFNLLNDSNRDNLIKKSFRKKTNLNIKKFELFKTLIEQYNLLKSANIHENHIDSWFNIIYHHYIYNLRKSESMPTIAIIF